MTIEVLHERGLSNRAIARQLGVHEHAVRYRLRRQASGAADGRREKPFAAQPWCEAITHWMQTQAERGVNLQALYAWLVAEHGYSGSYKAIQRFVRARYPRPKLRVRRRVETPPGAQAQADWAEFPGLHVGGMLGTLFAFHLCCRTRGWRRSCGRRRPTSWPGSRCTTRRCDGSVACRR